MKHISFAAAVIALLFTTPAWASQCQAVGGVVMTNIGAIEGVTNLGLFPATSKDRSPQPSRIRTVKGTIWSSTTGSPARAKRSR